MFHVQNIEGVQVKPEDIPHLETREEDFSSINDNVDLSRNISRESVVKLAKTLLPLKRLALWRPPPNWHPPLKIKVPQLLGGEEVLEVCQLLHLVCREWQTRTDKSTLNTLFEYLQNEELTDVVQVIINNKRVIG